VATWLPLDVEPDGDPDIVSRTCDIVIAYLNEGDGSFFSTLPIGGVTFTASLPGDIRSADLDGRNGPDLAFLAYEFPSYEYGVLVLLRDADGSFGDPAFYQTSTQMFAMDVCDVNGDLSLDMIVSGKVVSVFANDGAGSFTIDSHYQMRDVALSAPCGDFDGDGDPDVAFINQTLGSVRILRNTRNR
jgi:hypothetical protein